MTTTVRITATTNAATYTSTVGAGSRKTFRVVGLRVGESVIVMTPNSSAAYTAMSEKDDAGRDYVPDMTSTNNQITLLGPLDFQLSKSITDASVEVVEYT